jgi:hypothetical protein
MIFIWPFKKDSIPLSRKYPKPPKNEPRIIKGSN